MDNRRLVFLELGGTLSGGGGAGGATPTSSPAVEAIVGLPCRLLGTVRKSRRRTGITLVELDRIERICMGPSPEEDDESLPASREIAEPPNSCMKSAQ